MNHFIKEGICVIEAISTRGGEDEFEEDGKRGGSEGEAGGKKRAEGCRSSSSVVGKEKRVD